MRFSVNFVGSNRCYEFDEVSKMNVNLVDDVFISHPTDGLFYGEIISPDRDCRTDKRKLARDSIVKEAIDSIIFVWNGTVKLFQYDLLKNPCHMDSEARKLLIDKGLERVDLSMCEPAILFVIDSDRTLRAFTVSTDTGENAKFMDKFHDGIVIAKITGNGLDGNGHFFAGRNRDNIGEWGQYSSGDIIGFRPDSDFDDPHSGLLAGYLNKVSIRLDYNGKSHESMLSLICDAYRDAIIRLSL